MPFRIQNIRYVFIGYYITLFYIQTAQNVINY